MKASVGLQVRLVRLAWKGRALAGDFSGLALAAAARRAPCGPLPSSPRRVLILKLDEIGDALMGLPFLSALRKRWPDAEVRVLCKPSVAPLYAAVPEVGAAIPYGPLAGKNMGPLAAWREARAFATGSLAPWRPDVCINQRWGFDLTGSAWLALYSGAPCRVAWSEKATPLKGRLNRGYDRAYSLVLGPTPRMHQVEQGLAMARALGAKPLARRAGGLKIPASDRAWARKALPASKYLALAPGASHPKKRWPEERFAALAKHAADRWGLKPVLLGSAADRETGDSILALAGAGGLNLCGEGGLLRSLAALGRCAALAGNDSGPAHMAAAMGTPSVVVSSFAEDSDPAADNAPARFHPWGAPHRLLQPERQETPCRGECEAYSAHCILDVDVERAVRALGGLLSKA